MSSRRLLFGCGLAFAILLFALFCLPFVWSAGREILYRRILRHALEGPIAYIEFQPNTDWPNRRISEPDQIDAVKTWLQNSHENSVLRSAPPRAACEMRFVFQNGRVEIIEHSPFRERLSDEGLPDVRGDVRFLFRGFDRSGSTEQLAAILDPA